MGMHDGGPGRSLRWKTPPDLFADLAAAAGGFDLDVCAEEGNAQCLTWIGEAQDGLRTSWREYAEEFGPDAAANTRRLRAWLNPPYGADNLRKWLGAAEAARDENMETWALIPLSPDADWWGQCVDPYADEIWTVRGRVLFHEDLGDGRWGKRTSPKFSSAVVIYRPQAAGLLADSPRWRCYVQPRLR